MVFRKFHNIFEVVNERKDHLLISIKQSDCILLWVCGNDFYTIRRHIQPVLLNEINMAGKEIVLVNVGMELNEFKEQFEEQFNSCHCFPKDDFKNVNPSLYQVLPNINKLVKVYEQNLIFDQFITYFEREVFSFQHELIKSLKKFDYTQQTNEVLDALDSNPQVAFFALNGSEDCGLEVLASRIVHEIGEDRQREDRERYVTPLIKPIDFQAYNPKNIDELLSILFEDSGKDKNRNVEECLGDLFRNNGDLFFVFHNFLLANCEKAEKNLRIEILHELANKLDLIQTSENWTGRCFFLVVNKNPHQIREKTTGYKIRNLPRVISLNTRRGKNEIIRWKDNLSLPERKATIIKEDIPDASGVGLFLLEVCEKLGAGDIYHQQLVKL